MTNHRELKVLGAYRDARRQFVSQVVEQATAFTLSTTSQKLDDASEEELRSENVFHIAELYYLFRAANFRHDADAFRAYLRQHKEGLEQKLKTVRPAGSLKVARTPDGLSKKRLEDGNMSDEVIESLVQHTRRFAPQSGLMLDQTKIASLLTEIMSPETCRTALLLLADCGFFVRTGLAPVTVTSTDKLETLFAEYLTTIADTLDVRTEQES